MTMAKCASVALFLLLASVVARPCSLGDITVTSVKAGFVDACSNTPCYSLKGVATLTNRCKDAIGVQLQITALDKKGAPVATSEFWPASTRNIAPGSFTFSLDHALDYSPGVASFRLTPVAIERWR
jgi:hypothetical protein